MPQHINPLALAKLIEFIHKNPHLLLHYDAELRQLVAYPWPLNKELEPISADDLINHQALHSFTFPGCFCPALSGSRRDVQSAVFVAPNEIYEKRYIAACSTRSCDHVVRLYFRPGQVAQYYPQRVTSNPLLPRPFSLLSDAPVRQDLANQSSSSDTERGPRPYPVLCCVPLFFPPSPQNEATTPVLLYRLHSTLRPGLCGKDFHHLFMRCECGIVSTRRRHTFHVCLTALTAADRLNDISLLGEGEFLRLLYRLDAGISVDEFSQMFARCTCGLVTTKRRFTIHECLSIV